MITEAERKAFYLACEKVAGYEHPSWGALHFRDSSIEWLLERHGDVRLKKRVDGDVEYYAIEFNDKDGIISCAGESLTDALVAAVDCTED